MKHTAMKNFRRFVCFSGAKYPPSDDDLVALMRQLVPLIAAMDQETGCQGEPARPLGFQNEKTVWKILAPALPTIRDKPCVISCLAECTHGGPALRRASGLSTQRSECQILRKCRARRD